MQLYGSSDKVVETALVCRRMNLQAYFDPDNVADYESERRTFDGILGELNEQYYTLGTNILRLEELGFNSKQFDMSSRFYEYPDSYENTEFYNSLTMYIQSVAKISNATKGDLSFTPMRNISDDSISLYKAKL